LAFRFVTDRTVSNFFWVRRGQVASLEQSVEETFDFDLRLSRETSKLDLQQKLQRKAVEE